MEKKLGSGAESGQTHRFSANNRPKAWALARAHIMPTRHATHAGSERRSARHVHGSPPEGAPLPRPRSGPARPQGQRRDVNAAHAEVAARRRRAAPCAGLRGEDLRIVDLLREVGCLARGAQSNSSRGQHLWKSHLELVRVHHGYCRESPRRRERAASGRRERAARSRRSARGLN